MNWKRAKFTTRTRRFNFDLLALDLRLVKALHSLLSMTDIIKLNELVVLLVGRSTYFLDFAILSKDLNQLIVSGRWIQIKYDQGPLVLILLGWVVLMT